MGLNPLIIDFSEISKADEDLVGKKAHELGIISKLGIPLPEGFVITTEFFKEFLRLTGIDKEIKKVQALNHPAISDSIKKLFHPIQKQVMHQHILQTLTVELHKFYRKLSGIFKDQSLNVFSSSYNNKSIIFSGVLGDANLILKIKTIWSMSLEEPVAIAVQKNIKSGIKGKIFTQNPTTDKKLTEKQMNKLIDYCNIIQKHFYFPKVLDYIIVKDKIYITAIKPFTGRVEELPKPVVENRKSQKVLIKGISINHGIATGRVKILLSQHNGIEVKKGEVIVLPNLDSSMLKEIVNAKAVVIDPILPNSLEKALYRKTFKIPTIEGVKNATRMLQDGSVVTVNGYSGEIYSGGLVY